MKRLTLFAAIANFVLHFAVDTAAKEMKLDGALSPYLEPAILEFAPLFETERFPNIVVSRKGTLIATFGSQAVRSKRSTDGGTTWSDEIIIAEPGFHGGGTTVDERSGDILAFVEDQHPPAPLTIYRSQDDGLTWQAERPELIADSRGNLPSMHMNEHGITLRRGAHKGRLIRPSRFYGKQNKREEWPTHYTSAIYSDDGGRRWTTSDPFPEQGTGEAAVAELTDGTLYYNSRVHWEKRPNNLRRRSALSSDGGQTWKQWQIVDILPDGPQDTNYGCMGGLTRLNILGRDILVYSNCDSPSGRHHGTIWASFDGGKTWPIKRLLFEGRFAYSSLASGRPGTVTEGSIYAHFEGGTTGASTLARFNLAWILEGAQTGDGTLPTFSTNK